MDKWERKKEKRVMAGNGKKYFEADTFERIRKRIDDWSCKKKS